MANTVQGTNGNTYVEHDPNNGPYHETDALPGRGHRFGVGPEGQRSTIGYESYLSTRLGELGIVTPDVSATHAEPGNGVPLLNHRQAAQQHFAMAVGQITQPDSRTDPNSGVTEESNRSRKLFNLKIALDELEKSGGKLSDLMPWVKPPPTNAQVAEMIKNEFPKVMDDRPGLVNNSPDGKSILEAHSALLARSGLTKSEPLIVTSVDVNGSFKVAAAQQVATSAPAPAPAPAEIRLAVSKDVGGYNPFK